MHLFKLKVEIYLLAYWHSEKYCASPIYLLAKNLVYRLVGVPASGQIATFFWLIAWILLIARTSVLIAERFFTMGGQH